MRKIVNIYIMLFLVDGIVSLVNTMMGQLVGIQPLSILQGIIASIVLVLSFVLYFIMGGTRGFPKRFLLPMILISIWAGLFFALPFLCIWVFTIRNSFCRSFNRALLSWQLSSCDVLAIINAGYTTGLLLRNLFLDGSDFSVSQLQM